MSAPQSVLTLIENFERNLDAYRNGKYNETQVRRDFIDPLFKALGWDMDNSLGYAEAYRDVIHEDAIKVGNSTKAPDYSFRVGGARKFFLEAKKPAVNVKDNIEPAFQLRRYAWSAKLPLSIVTDFEEFAIYDCRQKPDKNDKASKSRLFYCTYLDYAEKWDEIAAIFSKDAVLKGSFDKYASTSKGKRGTTEVDGAFLEEIEGWRDLLARNIALRNDNLSQRDLNFAVQQTIDRIIFLRICEDRGIEPYGKLMALQNGVNVYARLREMFHDADDRYNSGLFHFKREKGRAVAPDELTLNLEIDDKPLKEIFKNLYYPDSPYEFSVLGADILGSVYEQFLGKVIRLTSGNRAVVEDKPEVKKAGGVFYTPAYIVKYIIEHTVGKLLAGKSAAQAEGIRILDPACGSGSFLIGAYQYLLDWYLAHYVEEGTAKNSQGKAARIRPSAHGAWRLTTAEKKRILLEHIYGVDIDAQAVEVTKLSLLLKMLEGESDESLISQGKLFHERVLPDLERNIQCGNSLIAPDFYDGQLDLDDEAVQRINVFDWQAAFPQVFKSPPPPLFQSGATPNPQPPMQKVGNPQPPLQKGVERSGGGFDVVIGNPPYALVGSDQPAQQEYFTNGRFKLTAYKTNLYVLFLERGLGLLRSETGCLGYIIPKSLVFNTYFSSTRAQLLQKFTIPLIVEIRDKVFAEAEVGDSLLFFAKNARATEKSELCYRVVKNVSPVENTIEEFSEKNFTLLRADGAFFRPNDGLVLRLKTLPLASSWRVNNGLNPGNVRHILFAESKESAKHRKLLLGRDLQRYKLTWSGTWVNFDPSLKTKLTPSDVKSKAGMTAQMKVDFAFRSPDIYLPPKIMVRKTADHIIACLDEGDFCFDSLSYGIQAIQGTREDSLYLLGLLNSKFLNYVHSGLSQNKEKVFAKVLAVNLKKLPLPILDLNNVTDGAKHDKLVALVEKMLALHQQLTTTKTPQDSTLLQRQIAATDKQIDQLVYALYGLSEEEIALVEGA